MSDSPFRIARLWWFFVLVGVIDVIVGVLVIAHPGFSLLALGILAGFYLVLVALVTIVEGITGPAERRTISILLGVLALIAGLICIRRPGESLFALVVVVGIYLIAVGVTRLVTAFGAHGSRGPTMLMAAVDIALGVVLLSLPHVSLATLAILFGISMVVRGIFDVLAGLAVRRIGGAEQPSTSGGTPLPI